MWVKSSGQLKLQQDLGKMEMVKPESLNGIHRNLTINCVAHEVWWEEREYVTQVWLSYSKEERRDEQPTVL